MRKLGSTSSCIAGSGKDDTAQTEEAVRDAFAAGLSSPAIRQRFLEKKTLTSTEAGNPVRGEEMAILNSEAYFADTQTNCQAASEALGILNVSIRLKERFATITRRGGSVALKANTFSAVLAVIDKVTTELQAFFKKPH